MMETIAIFAVGMVLGWQWCAWWKERPVEASINEKVRAVMADVVADFRSIDRFVGPSMTLEKSWTGITSIGEIEVVVRRKALDTVDL